MRDIPLFTVYCKISCRICVSIANICIFFVKHRSIQYLALSFQAIQFPLYFQGCSNDLLYFEYNRKPHVFHFVRVAFSVMGADWCGIFLAHNIFRVCSTDLSFAANVLICLFFPVVCHSCY